MTHKSQFVVIGAGPYGLAVASHLVLDRRTSTPDVWLWPENPKICLLCTKPLRSRIQRQIAGHRQTVFFKSKNSLAVVYPGGSSGYSLRHSILFEVLLWPMRSLALATASVTWLLPL